MRKEEGATFIRTYDKRHFQIQNIGKTRIYISGRNGKPILVRGREKEKAFILDPQEFLEVHV